MCIKFGDFSAICTVINSGFVLYNELVKGDYIMPRRVVRALQLGDSDNLSDNYWTLRNGIYDKKFDVTDTEELITALSESELVYLYWELKYAKYTTNWAKLNAYFLREQLTDEFMNRKYKRGRYKNG